MVDLEKFIFWGVPLKEYLTNRLKYPITTPPYSAKEYIKTPKQVFYNVCDAKGIDVFGSACWAKDVAEKIAREANRLSGIYEGTVKTEEAVVSEKNESEMGIAEEEIISTEEAVTGASVADAPKGVAKLEALILPPGEDPNTLNQTPTARTLLKIKIVCDLSDLLHISLHRATAIVESLEEANDLENTLPWD